MSSIDDQIRQARSQRLAATSNVSTSSSSSNIKEDGRGGIAFGTGVAYDDDIYDETTHTNGGDGGFVSSLPTIEEENRMILGEGDERWSYKNHDDDDDDDDVGRTSWHPSSIPKGMMQQVRDC